MFFEFVWQANVRLQPQRLIITPAALGCKACRAVCRFCRLRSFGVPVVSSGQALHQCTGCTGPRSHAVDCQFEMTALSPQWGHCHVIRSSAHTWCSIMPGTHDGRGAAGI
jgi:hypothetical protein